MRDYSGFFESLPDEAAGFSLSCQSDGYYLFRCHSPAGEDICIEGDLDADSPHEALSQLKADVTRKYESSDVDEHVDLWASGRGERGVPSTYEALVEDAKAIGEMLGELDRAVSKWELPSDLGVRCPICGHPFLKPEKNLIAVDGVLRFMTVYDCPECFMRSDADAVSVFWGADAERRGELRSEIIEQYIAKLDSLFEANGGDERCR